MTVKLLTFLQVLFTYFAIGVFFSWSFCARFSINHNSGYLWQIGFHFLNRLFWVFLLVFDFFFFKKKANKYSAFCFLPVQIKCQKDNFTFLYCVFIVKSMYFCF